MARISDNSLWGIAQCYFFNFPKQCFNSYLGKRNASFKITSCKELCELPLQVCVSSTVQVGKEDQELT